LESFMKNTTLTDDILNEAAVAVQPNPGEAPLDGTSFDASPFDVSPDDSAAGVQRPRQEWRRSLISRMAMRLAPLYGSFYDWQMERGGGVRVVRHKMQLPLYPGSAPALRAVFLSDLHYGPTSGSVAARQAWQLAREARPDILLMGGD
jgi:hypothetical protein